MSKGQPLGYQPATEEDGALLDAARSAIRKRYRYGSHHVGAAVRTRSCAVFTGVHLETTVGRAAVCAEPIAIGAAITAEGPGTIVAVAAVRHPDPESPLTDLYTVPPCGICRELIADHAPEAVIVLEDEHGQLVRRPNLELLPHKYDPHPAPETK